MFGLLRYLFFNSRLIFIFIVSLESCGEGECIWYCANIAGALLGAKLYSIVILSFFGKVLECLDLIQVTRQVLQAKDMRAKEFTYLQDPLSISVSSEI